MHDASMDEAPARAARIDAPLLNARLSKAQDADELLGLFARHGWQMDGMHYGNLWNKLGRQLRESSGRQAWVARHASTLKRLVSATTSHLRTCGAQPLANVAHGAAHVGNPNPNLNPDPSPSPSPNPNPNPSSNPTPNTSPNTNTNKACRRR